MPRLAPVTTATLPWSRFIRSEAVELSRATEYPPRPVRGADQPRHSLPVGGGHALLPQILRQPLQVDVVVGRDHAILQGEPPSVLDVPVILPCSAAGVTATVAPRTPAVLHSPALVSRGAERALGPGIEPGSIREEGNGTRPPSTP